jgi:hypothetical protein
MGWASGSEVMLNIIETAKKYVPAKVRKAFYIEIIKALESQDWDTQNEAEGEDPLYDQALRELYPDEDDGD